METAKSFFDTWGLGKYPLDIMLKNSTFKKFLTVKNIVDYIPIIGLASAIFFAVVMKTPGTKDNPNQFHELPRATKAGLLSHAILGGVGGGIFCLAGDAIASIVRCVQSAKARKALPKTFETKRV